MLPLELRLTICEELALLIEQKLSKARGATFGIETDHLQRREATLEREAFKSRRYVSTLLMEQKLPRTKMGRYRWNKNFQNTKWTLRKEQKLHGATKGRYIRIRNCVEPQKGRYVWNRNCLEPLKERYVWNRNCLEPVKGYATDGTEIASEKGGY